MKIGQQHDRAFDQQADIVPDHHFKRTQGFSLTTTIGPVMTGYPYSIETNAHLSTVKSMLAQYNIHHLPVRNGDKWVGVTTTRDLRIAEDLGVDI